MLYPSHWLLLYQCCQGGGQRANLSLVKASVGEMLKRISCITCSTGKLHVCLQLGNPLPLDFFFSTSTLYIALSKPQVAFTSMLSGRRAMGHIITVLGQGRGGIYKSNLHDLFCAL